MQKSNWLRIGLIGFVTMAGGATALVACGGDDTEENPTTDGGVTSSSGSSGVSSGGASSGGASSRGGSSSSSGGVEIPPAALTVVHGAIEADVGPVKICFAASPTAMPEAGATPQILAPLPASPTGLIPGSAGILPRLGAPLEQLNILPYLVKLSSLTGANENKACDELIGAGKPLVDGTDYFTLAGIPAGTLKDEKSYVLVAKKGPDAAHKVVAVLFEQDTATAIPSDKVGAQFIYASDYLTLASVGGTDVAPFIDRPAGAVDADAGVLDAGDAGGPPPGRAFEYLIGDDNTTKANPYAPISATKILGAFDEPMTTGAGIQIGALNTTLLNAQSALGGGVSTVPILYWSALSDPSKAQGDGAASLYFKGGNAFTWVLVGDPTAPAPATNPPTTAEDIAKTYARMHWLVFPNKPIVPSTL